MSLVCLLGSLDDQDKVQLGGEVDGLGEEIVVVDVGDVGTVHHVLVLVGRGGSAVELF